MVAMHLCQKTPDWLQGVLFTRQSELEFSDECELCAQWFAFKLSTIEEKKGRWLCRQSSTRWLVMDSSFATWAWIPRARSFLMRKPQTLGVVPRVLIAPSHQNLAKCLLKRWSYRILAPNNFSDGHQLEFFSCVAHSARKENARTPTVLKCQRLENAQWLHSCNPNYTLVNTELSIY